MIRGFGLGLRPEHYRDFAQGGPAVDWLEILTENYLVPGGKPLDYLDRIRARYPVAMHGVSLSIAGESLDPEYLKQLEALARRVQPAWISDHLCWSSFGGHTGHDLWPLPFTEEALDHVAARVLTVQERLQRPVLIENVSSYLQFAHAGITEWEFLSALVARTGCGLLLDVNNVFVSAHNHGFSAQAFLEGLPPDSVGQIHLAGHRDEGTHLLDTHDHPVCDGVWDLYRAAVTRFGGVATLIERDEDIPPLDEVVAESRRARALEREVLGALEPVGGPTITPGVGARAHAL